MFIRDRHICREISCGRTQHKPGPSHPAAEYQYTEKEIQMHCADHQQGTGERAPTQEQEQGRWLLLDLFMKASHSLSKGTKVGSHHRHDL